MPLSQFFDRYAAISMGPRPEDLAVLYAPTFIVAGPQGSRAFKTRLRCPCALEARPVGNAINYAARILDAEERASGPDDQVFNTVILGPIAHEELRTQWGGFLSPVKIIPLPT